MGQHDKTRVPVEKAVVLSDIHIPVADNAKLALVLRFLKTFKPDVIFLNGDIIDNYSVSRWMKHPSVSFALQDEIAATKTFVKDLRRAHPKARIEYVFGNHEARFEAYIVERAPELYGYINLDELLGLEQLDINVTRSLHKENWLVYHNLWIGHYDKALSNAGSTALALMQQRGVNILQGHIHRIGMTAKRFFDRTIYAYENPCLASMDQPYVKYPNWQQGFTVIYALNGETWVYPIAIKDRAFVFDGVLYQEDADTHTPPNKRTSSRQR